ncbi:thioredoxin domain-containing protein [Agrococcus sp. Marseille-Q4369]|uniref:DsbA family protein n=1 Tax=Agrococcus sp. Marseille-Q4369 TaxID=2810513 RepID=UPI001B8B446A|nr:thioredoxin domain-containing protein [Agrococcus sp. Marseille-Q4369]QUW19875.1 thioredoxin domain-containing protein [Agrococcus sp. Marseille-Q4369]
MSEKLTKNERRAQAREQARRMQEERRKKERLKKGLTIGGIIVAAVAIVAIVAVVIVNSIRPAGPGPENMASNGIVIGAGFEAERTPATPPEGEPTPTEPRDDQIQIQIYQDYMCPACGAFDEANRATLEQLLETGAATVEVHPISILDRTSLGTKYSTRSASAAACVAEHAPDQFWAFNSAMFDNRPEEGTPGLTNDEIVGVAESAGIDTSGGLAECITEGRFMSWVEDATVRAGTEPLPGTDGEVADRTPTVIVNGERYAGAPGDAAGFQAFVTATAGSLTESPEPAESPAPSDG